MLTQTASTIAELYAPLTVLAWEDPEETPFVVIHAGEVVMADSLDLLIQALAQPLRLAA